jgi:demethylmenaquinone methyltransferase/2-methoxy-6-polyprenyl-1,4-benzoquinol methylase
MPENLQTSPEITPRMTEYAQRLAEIDPLRAPAIRAAIDALHLPAGSRGLDAGCGIGLHTWRLAERVGEEGHVTGLDRSAAFVYLAEQRAAAAGVSGRTAFQIGDLTVLEYPDDTYDWLWCNDALWPGPAEMGCPTDGPLPVVRGFARVVRPGGTVALVYWSSQRLLPGYPALEARLSAAPQTFAPYSEGMRPQQHCMRALGWLEAAGLRDVAARSFVAEVQAPLGAAQRRALEVTLDMFWGQVQDEVSAEDWALLQRLRRAESPECVLDAPDYYGFLTYTVFAGKVPGSKALSTAGAALGFA